MLVDNIPPFVYQIRTGSDGFLYRWDKNRGKYLGFEYRYLLFSKARRGITGTLWFDSIDNIPTNVYGYLIEYPSCLTTLMFQSLNVTADIQIEIFNGTQVVHSVNVTNTDQYIDNGLNIDLPTNADLRVKCTITGGSSNYPRVTIALARRL